MVRVGDHGGRGSGEGGMAGWIDEFEFEGWVFCASHALP